MKSIAAPAGAGAIKSVPVNDAGRNGLMVKSGEKMTGLAVTITDGAAGVGGKVIPDKEGAQLPARLLVHVVPAETGGADDTLRYAEAIARVDGSFLLNNIAPGKDWLIARAAPNDEMNDNLAAPIAWDAGERAKLRKEAEAMKIDVDLKPCQRASGLIVKYR